MNQTRTFLLFALVAVAYLLWNAWEKDYGPQPSTSVTTSASAEKTGAANGTDGVPGAVTAAKVPVDAAPAGETAGQLITVTTDVLRLTIDTRGGSLIRSELLGYPVTPRTKKNPDPAPIRLLDDRGEHFFAAQDGLISASGAAPDHRTLFQAARTRYTLDPGQNTIEIPLTWTDASGVRVTKRYTVHRGSYVVELSQEIDNGSASAWTGNAYRQLQRVVPPPPVHSNFLEKFSDQSRYSFFGAAWYSPEKKFDKLAFDKFSEDPLNLVVTGGWLAMEQHYFVTAWLPPANEAQTFSTTVLSDPNGPRYLVRDMGPSITVAPGQQQTSQARLYVGPKLREQLATIAPGLELTLDYGMFSIVASPLHWVLNQLEKLTGNWGFAIILLVLLINIAIYKLSEAQYVSAARMRKLKPRMDALKERYGDDKQKMQQAMMELYKKEKINPVAGCLPVLITIPIFFALYTVLRESVELRQAPFVGWIHDLSAADPYFVLPAIYVLVMLATQWMMPQQPGMDPTQAKMMKFMPLMFAVMFAFFPAGLVVYYIVNGLCRLVQQWWVTRRIDRADAAKGQAIAKG
ncbi:membrane protein insertase YidC [Dyella sp.]|jgi:YidC/Oxa1 family membrane protein insertase|uniref:membrane protein insertase YidC n=1 Tax=Dyella sp. TaxID=1869338 RepID=UPI002D7A2374|nr:membrane protein insertase YidC [Dyella sp.]HET6430906.1 membrane protein insertase YidC [Dyella sp.]